LSAGVEIAGFEYRRLEVGETRYLAGVAGAGVPVLLLHGYPQHQYCWHRVAPVLARTNTVVVCDLKGYGASRAPTGGPLGEGYSKREMAAELVELMAILGHGRFAVCGHDRGGRVAYRMALDAPGRIERLCVLNVVPTVDQFERMGAQASVDYWPWFLLAQPAPFAEQVVGASAEIVVRQALETWVATPGAIAADAAQRYVSAFTPEVIAAVCADYRAAFHLDRPLDAADRAAGRRIECPVLVHWGAEEGGLADGPLAVWRRWAADVRGGAVPYGHFLPEEAAAEVAGSLQAFLA
jgi:haloacetate dehalogenase